MKTLCYYYEFIKAYTKENFTYLLSSYRIGNSTQSDFSSSKTKIVQISNMLYSSLFFWHQGFLYTYCTLNVSLLSNIDNTANFFFYALDGGGYCSKYIRFVFLFILKSMKSKTLTEGKGKIQVPGYQCWIQKV